LKYSIARKNYNKSNNKKLFRLKMAKVSHSEFYLFIGHRERKKCGKQIFPSIKFWIRSNE
jgi:hypothetical protein